MNRIRYYTLTSGCLLAYERAYARRQPLVRVSYGRIRRPLALKTHNFCERHSATNSLQIGTDSAPGSGLQKQFDLSQIRNSSQYMSLFEYYRIDKVVVKFRYKGPGVQAYSNTSDVVLHNEQNPLLYFKVDHNDISADSLSVLKDSMKTKSYVFTNDKSEFTITLKPAIQWAFSP